MIMLEVERLDVAVTSMSEAEADFGVDHAAVGFGADPVRVA